MRTYSVWQQVPRGTLQAAVIDTASVLYLCFRRPMDHIESEDVHPEYAWKVEGMRFYDGYWRVYVPTVAVGEALAAAWEAEDQVVYAKLMQRFRDELLCSDDEYDRRYERSTEYWGSGWWRNHLRQRLEGSQARVLARAAVLPRDVILALPDLTTAAAPPILGAVSSDTLAMAERG